MTAIVGFVIAYPTLRASQVLPTAEIISLFDKMSAERAASLAFRFGNEDALIARAMERPMYGWGAYGRGRIWTEWGEDVSVTDGYWIILLGSSGVIGLGGFLALMVWPILRYVRCRARMTPPAQLLLGALALLLSISTLDLLPNPRADYLPMAFAGALFTLSERLARARHPSSRQHDPRWGSLPLWRRLEAQEPTLGAISRAEHLARPRPSPGECGAHPSPRVKIET
jgi:hypothetical protein